MLSKLTGYQYPLSIQRLFYASYTSSGTRPSAPTDRRVVVRWGSTTIARTHRDHIGRMSREHTRMSLYVHDIPVKLIFARVPIGIPAYSPSATVRAALGKWIEHGSFDEEGMTLRRYYGPSRYGRRPFPRRKLHPDFAVAVRDYPENQYAIARHLGQATGQVLSGWLNGGEVVMTPLAIRRLQALAALVAYDGDVFLPEGETFPTPRPTDDAFDTTPTAREAR
jgi:hypothetical protein